MGQRAAANAAQVAWRRSRERGPGGRAEPVVFPGPRARLLACLHCGAVAASSTHGSDISAACILLTFSSLLRRRPVSLYRPSYWYLPLSCLDLFSVLSCSPPPLPVALFVTALTAASGFFQSHMFSFCLPCPVPPSLRSVSSTGRAQRPLIAVGSPSIWSWRISWRARHTSLCPSIFDQLLCLVAFLGSASAWP